MYALTCMYVYTRATMRMHMRMRMCMCMCTVLCALCMLMHILSAPWTPASDPMVMMGSQQ